MLEPVVITALGIVSAHGIGLQANAQGFFQGKRALSPITVFDPSRQRVQQGGQVCLPLEKGEQAWGKLSKRELGCLDRASQLLVLAGLEAWQNSNLSTEKEQKIPFVLGTSAAAMERGEAFYRGLKSEQENGSRAKQRRNARFYHPAAQAVALQKAMGVRGSVRMIANACASGANALATAAARIRSGQDEVVLAGGYDALSELVFAGFDSLQALSTTQSRPFAADRDGLVMGEGAAVCVLESLTHAKKRGATILAQLSGWGQATDLHHLTQPHPEGDAAFLTMQQACEMAGCSAAQVDYVNAHGTGTPKNDVAEANAISRWAGESSSHLLVSSTKGQVGHTLGAAGAIEAVVCVLALQQGKVPPNVAIENADPACQFTLVQEPLQKRLSRVLSNSFGFGGANCSLLFERFCSEEKGG